jgi:DNA polymerase-3 subunit delta
MAAGRKRSNYGQTRAANLGTMRTLAEDIARKHFRRVYLLYGSESYLRIQFRSRLRYAIADRSDTMNVTVFSGKNIDEKEVIRTADTFPFFADHRVVIVEGSGFFKGSRKSLAEYIERIPETTCIIFDEEDVDPKGALFNAVKKHGLAAQLSFPDEDSLRKWLLSSVTAAGKKIRTSDLDYFISLVTPSMNALHSEMEKLISYTGNEEVIRRVPSASTASQPHPVPCFLCEELDAFSRVLVLGLAE